MTHIATILIALGLKFLTKNLTESREFAESYQTLSVSVWVWECDWLETAIVIALYK